VRKTALCLAMLVLAITFAVGQQYKVLYNFGAQTGDGANPVSNLIFDKAGNLYGTTSAGGSASGCIGGCGTVFELSPNSDGSWTETVLYSFCSKQTHHGFCLDGNEPAAGLVFDVGGNLYGTTVHGGPARCPMSPDCGTVFKLAPPSLPDGSWTESVLYSFCSKLVNSQCLDGLNPYGQLTVDQFGDLYGTTSAGGTGRNSGGTVFELSRVNSGQRYTVLYNFCSVGSGKLCSDGTFPVAGVTFDKLGNLYGTTLAGGDSQGRGTVYELVPQGKGWNETVLETSERYAAEGPQGTVTLDSLGNIYTTYSQGGEFGFGGVFRIGTQGGISQLSFTQSDGLVPTAGLVADFKQGILYGTTSGGQELPGTVFAVTAPSQLTVLYNFCAQPGCTDGEFPYGALVEDASGNLYGTTKKGGAYNQGVVFEITP
jgi:uncharacterized repeat protein (TIGR03803 family)